MSVIKKANRYASKKLGIEIYRTNHNLLPVYVRRSGVWTNTKELEKFDLKSYIEKLNNTFLGCVKDPDFISTAKKPTPLVINIDKSTKSLKLSIPTAQNFHLHSMELLDGSGKTLKVPTKTKVEVSSQVNQYDNMTDTERKKRLFSPNGKHTFAFYTQSVKNSWVKITFPKNIDISSVKINNVKKHIDPRENSTQKALGLQVRTSIDGDIYKIVYDMGGIKNFNKPALKLAQSMGLNRYKSGKDLFDFTVAVMQCRKLKTKKLFKTIPIEYRKTVTKTLNETILYDRNMEWTSHGIRRSFRFWSKAEKQDYIDTATDLMKKLTKLSPDVCLAFGSVLAVVRDKDFMPHDDDVDTLIVFNKSQVATYKEAFSLIAKYLEPMGYIIRAEVFNLLKVGIGNCKVDVFVAIYDDDDTMGLYPNERHIMKRSDMFPAKEVDFIGTKTLIPRDSEKYLAYTYGPKWRTPDPNFKYKRKKSKYADIAR